MDRKARQGTGRAGQGSAGSKPDASSSSEEGVFHEDGAELRDDVPEVSIDVRELRGELDQVNDRHLRLAAEFDNYRRRAQAQLADSRARAQAELVGKIVGVLDDLRRVTAVDPGTASVGSVIEGVSLLERKLYQALVEAGLDDIDPKGEPFDPNTMEALTRAPADSEAEDDTVAEVFQRGFRFGGHLVRPARVSVRKYE